MAIVSGERPQAIDEFSDPEFNSNASSDDSSVSSDDEQISEDKPSQTELQHLCQAVKNSITNLLKLSVAILKSPTHDDYSKLASEEPINDSFDISHVQQKHPGAMPWLVSRLGKANARRRQYLSYRERHRQKLSQEVRASHGDIEPGEEAKKGETALPVRSTSMMEDRRSHLGGPTTSVAVTQTTAKTYVAPTVQDVDRSSDSGRSETSDASFLADDDTGDLRVPPAPKGSEDEQPFECPYCFTIQTITSDRAWK